MAREPLNLTQQERDILMDILLKEVNDIGNHNATIQNCLKQYKQDVLAIYKKVLAIYKKVLAIYKKVVANMDED